MTIKDGPLIATVRECWIDAENRRLSGDFPEWTEGPTIHSIVIETVKVEESQRRQGHFKRFLAAICADPGFDMVVVQGVQNPHLAEYLMHEGWEFDRGVMDFYRKRRDA